MTRFGVALLDRWIAFLREAELMLIKSPSATGRWFACWPLRTISSNQFASLPLLPFAFSYPLSFGIFNPCYSLLGELLTDFPSIDILLSNLHAHFLISPHLCVLCFLRRILSVFLRIGQTYSKRREGGYQMKWDQGKKKEVQGRKHGHKLRTGGQGRKCNCPQLKMS